MKKYLNHKSIPLTEPIELINIEPLSFSPLISKCQIKVCYVSDEPNRNGTVITKEVAKEFAPSLRGSPIVGHYDEGKEDFEEHNKILEIKNNQIKVIEDTRPYGFVDLNANVWFQKFLDDDTIEREYLVTEGYLWTGQYPEVQKVVNDNENSQSMELDNDGTKGCWTSFNNANTKFFIINETVISKLCILGKDVEPCFEGSNITSAVTEFSLDDGFKQTVYSFMKDIKEILSKGGENKMYTEYAIDIGNMLYNIIMNFLYEKYSENFDEYYIEGVYEENGNKFFVVYQRKTGQYLRFNFTYSENEFSVEEPIECSKNFTPREQPLYNSDEAKEYIKKFKEEKGKIEQPTKDEIENPVGDYSLEDIPEYQEALGKIATLENQLSEKDGIITDLNSQIEQLKEFKSNIEHQKKEELIDSFYMLSDENKKDVKEHIDEYSLDDIEAKLSIICVRNKVNLSEPHDNDNTYTYTPQSEVDNTPDWIKSIINTSKELND